MFVPRTSRVRRAYLASSLVSDEYPIDCHYSSGLSNCSPLTARREEKENGREPEFHRGCRAEVVESWLRWVATAAPCEDCALGSARSASRRCHYHQQRIAGEKRVFSHFQSATSSVAVWLCFQDGVVELSSSRRGNRGRIREQRLTFWEQRLY